MRIIILGSASEITSVAYKQLGLPESVLVTSTVQEFSCGHTSPHDITEQAELENLLSSSRVYWAFPEIDEFDSEDVYYYYLDWVKEYQYKYRNIENFDSITFDPYNWKPHVPVLKANDCVFIGCSFTEGIGLDEPSEESYTKLVSDYYGANCVNLGKGGSSNYRSFDLLSQLDFHQEQQVILQITLPARLRYIEEDKKIHDIILSSTLPHTYSRALIDVYNKNYLLYQLIVKLRTFVKLAREKKLKFIFWLIDYKTDKAFSKKEQLCFFEYPEFVPARLMQNFLVDFGTDGLHPGPESQKLIANGIIDHMNKLYY